MIALCKYEARTSQVNKHNNCSGLWANILKHRHVWLIIQSLGKLCPDIPNIPQIIQKYSWLYALKYYGYIFGNLNNYRIRLQLPNII